MATGMCKDETLRNYFVIRTVKIATKLAFLNKHALTLVAMIMLLGMSSGSLHTCSNRGLGDYLEKVAQAVVPPLLYNANELSNTALLLTLHAYIGVGSLWFDHCTPRAEAQYKSIVSPGSAASC